MILPANNFGARHESRGEDGAGSTGTTITASGSTNTKGSYADLGAVTSFAWECLTVYMASNSAAADYLVDIAIDDGAGNRFVIVPDLHYPARKEVNEHNFQMRIPVHVPAGAQLSARCQASSASAACEIIVVGHSSNVGGFPGYSRAVALFATPGNSRGVSIDPGASGYPTWGSWVEMIASCPVDVEAIFGVIGHNGDVSRAAGAYCYNDIGIGAGGSEFSIFYAYMFIMSTAWDGPTDVFFQPKACQIAAGTRIAARGRNTVTTAGDRAWDLSLYGLAS